MSRYLDVAEVIIVALESKQGRVTFINQKGCQILGYSREEIIGTNWFDKFIPPPEQEKVKKIFFNLVQGKVGNLKHYQNHIVTKNGEERLIAWHNAIITDENGNVIETVSSGTDMTELHRYQRQLKDSQEFLAKIIDTMAEPLFAEDKYGRVVLVNNTFCNFLDKSKDEILYRRIEEILPQEVAKELNAKNEELLRGKRQSLTYTTTLLILDRKIKEVRIHKSLYINDKGETFIVGVVEDITEIKHAEEKIESLYNLTRQILEKAPFGVYVVNEEGNIDYVNPAMLEISGDTREEFESLNVFSLENYKNSGLDKKIKEVLIKSIPFTLKEVEYTSFYGKKTTIRNFVGIPFEEKGKRKALIFVENLSDLKKLRRGLTGK